MAESSYYLAIAIAFVGFVTLAFLLLFPVYRFLQREEEQSEQWTKRAIAQRQRQAMQRDQPTSSGDGMSDEPPDLDAPSA